MSILDRVRQSLFGRTEDESQSSGRVTRSQATQKEQEKGLIDNIVFMQCPTEIDSNPEDLKIFFHAVRFRTVKRLALGWIYKFKLIKVHCNGKITTIFTGFVSGFPF